MNADHVKIIAASLAYPVVAKELETTLQLEAQTLDRKRSNYLREQANALNDRARDLMAVITETDL
jgi:hypothetical protein